MIWFWGILAAVFVLDALRLRGRLSALPVLGEANVADEPGEGDEGDDLVTLTGPGVAVDAATADAASAYLDREGLAAVDLVPAGLRVGEALGLMAVVDPATYRNKPLVRGRSAGAALVTRSELASRARLTLSDFPAGDAVAIHRAAARTKLYAPRGVDFALAPGLSAPTPSPADRRALATLLFGRSTPVVFFFQLAVYAVLAVGAAWPAVWPAGLAALAAYHLQPLIATAGTGLRPPDLWSAVLFRLPLEVAIWFRTVTAPRRADDSASDEPDLLEQRRDEYAELLARDPGSLFEPRRDDCPLCGGFDLSVHLVTPDVFQHKPGRFTLERCEPCGHVFQNPRLSLEGLDFYYKDFYDGLGAQKLDFFFQAMGRMYRERGRMIGDLDETPERWLDVGGGHGHFCLAAKDEFPTTAFEALDLSDGVSEAEKRGWVENGYRGLFPDVAPTVANRYDVVSMYHYLEHARDPRAELAAAHRALRGNGLLMIEVPDPESRMGRVLGRYWMPWLQPQHLHFISVSNMGRLLREHGFEPLGWQRAEAHHKNDLAGAASLWLAGLAPMNEEPWRPRPTLLGRVWRRVVWTLGLPLIGLGFVGDLLLAPLLKKTTSSNTYRVLARKTATAASGVIDAAA